MKCFIGLKITREERVKFQKQASCLETTYFQDGATNKILEKITFGN